MRHGCEEERQENGSRNSHPPVILQSYTRLVCIRGLDEDQLVLPYFVQDALGTRRSQGSRTWIQAHKQPD